MEAHQLKYFKNRGNGEFIHLRGISAIQLTAVNLTKKDLTVNLFNNKHPHDVIEIKNNTPFYQDDDNNLTLLKNYINAVGHVEIILLRLHSTNASQLQKIIQYVLTDEKNDSKSESIFPFNYFSPQQFQTSILDIPLAHKKISRDVTFIFDLLAHSTYSMTMFCGMNKGDVQAKADSYYNKVKDTYEAEHFTMTDKNKKRMLILKD